MALASNDPANVLAGLIQAGQDVLRQFRMSASAGKEADSPLDPAEQIVAVSKSIVEMHQSYLQQMSTLWSAMLGAPAEDSEGTRQDDKRFASEAWRDDQRFDVLKRTYLAYADFLQNSVESAPVDDRTRGQLRFAVRQFVDAMSPANFFATNPEAMQLAMQTGGQSLTEGIRLFFEDLGKGRVSMTDESAFEVGKNLALTEGAVIYENELMQVIQYAPRTTEVYDRPLVIIPPCINKFYILDLQPENSLVRHAIDQGHTVFVLSWRNITAELGELTWDDYLRSGVMQAIDVALDVTGARTR